jgi:hypothetical protein
MVFGMPCNHTCNVPQLMLKLNNKCYSQTEHSAAVYLQIPEALCKIVYVINPLPTQNVPLKESRTKPRKQFILRI